MSTLDYPLQDHEIIKAVYSFRPSKSPRPDSLHLSFYQKHWEIVGKSVLETCHSIFKYVTMPLTPLTFVLFRKFPMQIILRTLGLSVYETLFIKLLQKLLQTI